MQPLWQLRLVGIVCAGLYKCHVAFCCPSEGSSLNNPKVQCIWKTMLATNAWLNVHHAMVVRKTCYLFTSENGFNIDTKQFYPYSQHVLNYYANFSAYSHIHNLEQVGLLSFKACKCSTQAAALRAKYDTWGSVSYSKWNMKTVRSAVCIKLTLQSWNMTTANH